MSEHPSLADVDRAALERVVRRSVEEQATYDYGSPEAIEQALKWDHYLRDTVTDTDERIRGDEVVQWASEQHDRRG